VPVCEADKRFIKMAAATFCVASVKKACSFTLQCDLNTEQAAAREILVRRYHFSTRNWQKNAALAESSDID
jgi:hypothetical protein